MAINLLLQPSSGASSDNADYTKQNVLINSKREIGRSILTDWESEVAAPSAGVGTFIREAGGVYQVQGTDENISGSPAAGINYIKTTVVGSVMTLEWVTVTTGYTYNEAYAGVYNGSGNQLLTDICYKDGTAFKRGRGNGMDFNTYILADGSVIYSGGLKTNGGDMDTDGGHVFTRSGDVATSGGGVLTDGGDIETSGGGIDTNGGYVETGGGDVETVGGNVDAVDGLTTENSGALKGFKGGYLVPLGWPAGTTQDTIYDVLSLYVTPTRTSLSVQGSYDVYPIFNIAKDPFNPQIFIKYLDYNLGHVTYTVVNGSATTSTDVINIFI